jgi:hypothetical protein
MASLTLAFLNAENLSRKVVKTALVSSEFVWRCILLWLVTGNDAKLRNFRTCVLLLLSLPHEQNCDFRTCVCDSSEVPDVMLLVHNFIEISQCLTVKELNESQVRFYGLFANL